LQVFVSACVSSYTRLKFDGSLAENPIEEREREVSRLADLAGR
jgi:hypothetical protein